MANKEAVKKWVEALRSGNYKQGKGALRATQRINPQEDKFCCLGVACDLAERDGVMLDVGFINPLPDPQPHDEVWNVSYDGDHLELPEAVQDWLGIYESNPLIYRGYSSNEPLRTLAEINDHVDNSFGFIASLIEVQYLIED